MPSFRVLIVPYYSVIGGWVIKYLIEYVKGNSQKLAEDGYFSEFISQWIPPQRSVFLIFAFLTVAIIYAGVRNGVERVSKFMMPVLVFLSVLITVYSVTRPGALAGVKYFLVPNMENFSWMTVVAAMGQMFYSLSIAMGILVTFGSYMKKDVSIEGSTKNVEMFDTAIAIMAGLMIIPAVFAFSGGDPDTLQAGPALNVYHHSEGFCQYGIGNSDWNSVLRTGALRSPYQLYCPDGERSIHIPGRTEMAQKESYRYCWCDHDSSWKSFFSWIWTAWHL